MIPHIELTEFLTKQIPGESQDPLPPSTENCILCPHIKAKHSLLPCPCSARLIDLKCSPLPTIYK